MKIEQKIQDEEYIFPYHYIPTLKNGGFDQTKYWSWGYRYLGGIKVVLDLLEGSQFKSLVDLGCGDGRFLREIKEFYPEKNILGIDYSGRAISLAKAMNPLISFKKANILNENIDEEFEVATAIEVLEHIPVNDLPGFLKATSEILTNNGHFILTVPHINKPLQQKHFQHFSSDKLDELLSVYFSEVTFIPFDPRSRLIEIFSKLIGGTGENYVITNSKINDWFFNLYVNKYLYADGESNCTRIAAICKK